MKIAFLSHAAASIYHFRLPIIKALLKRGDEILVLVPRDEYALKLENLSKELNFKLVFYDLNRKSLNPFVVFKNFLSLIKLLKSFKIELIQTAAHKSNTLGILASKFAKIPYKIALVEGLGSFYINESFKSFLIRKNIEFLYKLSFKVANLFIFVNESNAKFMHKLGLSEKKICIIKSVGINLKQFFPMKISKEVKEDFLKKLNLAQKPVVLMVARALWHKGVTEFYESANALFERANFILVGGRDDNISCASLEFLTSGKVCYLGARDDIAFLLNLCDIFVLPSYKEGFPVSVLEAKACGKACVVSDCEGCVEAVLNGHDGLLVKTKDAKDLSEKIEILLNDEKLRENLGKNAFKEALKYDDEEIAKKYLKAYDSLKFRKENV